MNTVHQTGRPLPSVVRRLGSLCARFAAALAVWELLVRAAVLRPDILPGPSRIAMEIFSEAPRLSGSAAVTTFEIAEALLAALLAGAVLSVLSQSFRQVRAFAGPSLSWLGRFPLIAAAPVFVAWYGYGPLPAALTAFFGALIPITAGLQSGLAAIPPEIRDLVQLSGAGTYRTLMKVDLPAMAPFLIRGLKSAVTFAVAGALAGEFAGSTTGLGYLLLTSASRLQTPLLFAAVTVVAAITAGLYLLIGILEWAFGPQPIEIFTGTGVSCR